MSPGRGCGELRGIAALHGALLPPAFLVFALLAPAGLQAQSSTGSPASLQDARLASALGIAPATSSLPLPQPLSPRFAGAALTPCSGVDLHAFLSAFDPHELLDELRDSILGGAQAAVSNYLLALAYSAPTLASILDMSDKTLNTRYAAFSRSCAVQHADSAVAAPAGRMAQAAAQCFSAQVAAGVAPTEALRRCTGGSSAAAPAGRVMAASLPTVEFLQRYADGPVAPRLAALLGLLPDARIEQGIFQTHPARLSVADLADLWTAGVRQALDMVDAGTATSSFAACAVPAGGDTPPACLPEAAAAVVGSPAYRATALLHPEARAIFKDALAGQIAVAQVYQALLELGRSVDSIQLRPGADATADEWLARRRQLQQDTAALLGQADLRARVQESRAAIAKMQLAALERARDDLQLQAQGYAGSEGRPPSGLRALLPLFADRR